MRKNESNNEMARRLIEIQEAVRAEKGKAGIVRFPPHPEPQTLEPLSYIAKRLKLRYDEIRNADRIRAHGLGVEW